MDLIVGATGMVGGEVCRLLAEQGRTVRALVRDSSNPERVERLKKMGAEIVRGDLKAKASIAEACRGADTVVSTASSTISRQEGDSLDSVDRQGQLDLIDAAEKAGVKHFVLVSFAGTDLDFPLLAAKRAAEDRLRNGRMTYTILQPTCFMEVWLGPHLGFDPANATARIYGGGNNKISWISFQDVAKFAAAAVTHPQAKNAVIRLGGPDALSPLEAVRLAEESTGKKIAVEHVPEEALRAQYDAATDPLQRSLAALMLYYAGGDVIDSQESVRAFSVKQMKPVREYLRSAASSPTVQHS
jgi:uncharacterized protein YbjT (DUF2867 family)